jgi:hypothetical protein
MNDAVSYDPYAMPTDAVQDPPVVLGLRPSAIRQATEQMLIAEGGSPGTLARI